MSPPGMRASASHGWERIAIFVFGVVFVITMLIVAFLAPNPTPFSLFVFRVVLALAAAGVAALIPGFFSIEVSNFIRAGGALGVFAAVYWFNPPALVVDDKAFEDAISRAEAALIRDNFESSKTFFEKARDIRPQHPAPYYGLGRLERKAGHPTSALKYYQDAFERSGKKDGSILYAMEMVQEGLGLYDEAERSLALAEELLPTNSQLALSALYDRGLLSLMRWIRERAPEEAPQYQKAEQFFQSFLERNGAPKQWVFYHLGCMHSTRANDSQLLLDVRGTYIARALEELEMSVNLLKDSSSEKAPLQREMMRVLLKTPDAWVRKPGEPIVCPALVKAWEVKRGSVDLLLAKLGK